ncbi:Geranylgeranyl pyrophosphate synthase [Gracilibacillus ureilyticus]|uniref:Geranylgeranyl pyrophosphate synthase n=1 Tax=Gracilibacillus ureilyticus TaxID=531814 RepID=A0A1H9Q5W7_9BACI|nr:polyprenyl synthetase family protein [Gracilibacillus ureilyticus]SER55850.1 Geranylgeranyl pyrophosphate synthase [Gracilibacillus ureilyticus]
MNDNQLKNSNTMYQAAEKQAEVYFQKLLHLIQSGEVFPALESDLETLKGKHSISRLFSISAKLVQTKEYSSYINLLKKSGSLTSYLERSISYIYLRDLGKSLASQETRERITSTVSDLEKYLTSKSGMEPFRLTELYRWAKNEQIEETFLWLMDKLKLVSDHIPEGMDKDNAKRKLIKIIGGVLLHEYDEMEENMEGNKRAKRLDEAIRLGYCYGLTYPFIDDLLDADILTAHEKKQYSDLLRTTFTNREVVVWKEWEGENEELIRFVHRELGEAFSFITQRISVELREKFFDQVNIFFQSQEIDREKNLTNPSLTNRELYLPVILKSSSSRLIVRSLISSTDKEIDNRTFYYGIYNQLSDDFTDFFQDYEDGAVTPYTYYFTYYDKRNDLINPFELYWAVIYYLIHNVYHSDKKTAHIILSRAINGLKRNKERLGEDKYQQLMGVFARNIKEFHQSILQLIHKVNDVDFFDKLLRDHMLKTMKENREEKKQFLRNVSVIRNRLNKRLPIQQSEEIRELITGAANYSLVSDAKRLRPIVASMVATDIYQLDEVAIIPLLKSLEYMHTASLIFDDLPSQDNASIRRGKPTLHEAYNSAVAELTGLFLTQKAYEEQAALDQFDPKSVLGLIQYSAKMTAQMCKGQAIDLESKGKKLTLSELNQMCYFKTGIGFEAAIIMPMILAQASDTEKSYMKKYAYHAGIAFQIKDDLLDVEGKKDIIGKPTGNDQHNDSSTFVSVLGIVEAKKAMWDHYCEAQESLDGMSQNSNFLKHLLDYFINREK